MFNTVAALFLSTKLLLPTPDFHVLARQSMDLSDRYPVVSVNKVMKENILLTLAYMQNPALKASHAGTAIQNPISATVTLHPDDVFAFHDAVLPKYKGKITDTTHAHFSSSEGFKSDGYLFGDGVCHLASLFNMAARQAGLTVEAPTPHDFAAIPGIPKNYGVSIYTTPLDPAKSARENLYITNSLDKDVYMTIQASASRVEVGILE